MSEHGQQDEDDNPSLYFSFFFSVGAHERMGWVDVVQGMEPILTQDLGIAKRRDPDALPPRNALEWCLNSVYLFLTRRGGNLLYAVKAGLFTGASLFGSFESPDGLG